jgi:hypothetical protein
LTLCLIQNRVPNKDKEKTPYKEWVGRKLSLSFLALGGVLGYTKGCIPTTLIISCISGWPIDGMAVRSTGRPIAKDQDGGPTGLAETTTTSA